MTTLANYKKLMEDLEINKASMSVNDYLSEYLRLYYIIEELGGYSDDNDDWYAPDVAEPAFLPKK
jgi:hypothetical protein